MQKHKQGSLPILESNLIFDLTKVVILMDNVWTGKKKRESEIASEPFRPVPFGWDDGGTAENVIPTRMQYFGAAGGGIAGPSSSLAMACANRNLVELWSFYLTDDILQYIADHTNLYGDGTWVRKVTRQEWRDLVGGGEGDTTTNRTHARPNVQVDMSTIETGGNVRVVENQPWYFRNQLPQDEEAGEVADDISSDDSSYHPSSDESTYYPHASKEDNDTSFDDIPSDDNSSDDSSMSRYNCDLSVPGSDADSDDEDDDDLELYGRLYEREPKERDRLVECSSDDPNKRKRWQVKGDPWVPVTVGYLTA